MSEPSFTELEIAWMTARGAYYAVCVLPGRDDVVQDWFDECERVVALTMLAKAEPTTDGRMVMQIVPKVKV